MPSETEPPAAEPQRRKVKRAPQQPVNAPPAAETITLKVVEQLRPDVDPAAKAPRMKVVRRGGDVLAPPFFFALVVGTALTVLGHLRGFELIGFFGPIGATAAYPLWGLARGFHKFPSLRERFADNAYYLGFIFTQIALLVGFGLPVLFGQSIKSDDVLRFFGVAIGASMVGLVARTILVQTGHTVDENADIVEQEVEALAQEVATLARGVSTRTKGMLDELDQVAAGLASARQGLDREVGAWVNDTGATLRGYDAQLRAQISAMADSTGVVAAAADRAQAGISEDRNELGQHVRAAAAAIDSLQQTLRGRVDEATGSIRETTASFTKGVDEVTQAQREMQERVADAAASMQNVAQSLNEGSHALRGLSGLDEAVGSLRGRVEEIAGGVDRLNDTVKTSGDALVRAVEQAASATAGAASRASAQASEAGEAAAADVRAIAEAAKADNQAKVEAIGRDLEAAVHALSTVLESFRKELERVRG